MKLLGLSLFVTVCLMTGCDSSSDSNETPSGTVTAIVGGETFTSTTITKIGSTSPTYSMKNSAGKRLDFKIVGISQPGQYSFFNQALSAGPGVAGGYYPGTETYSVDSGTIRFDTFTSSRIVGTFSGTARGLLGAADLNIANGTIDIQF